MKQKFRDIRLSKENKARLAQINNIIEEYQADGYVLTLRQLYYQLVSRDVIPNSQKEYKKLGGLLVEGRMAGIVDWEAIEDRVRRPSRPSFWSSPKNIMDSVVSQYRRDRMAGQETYLEVWVEKDALSGVLRRVTEKYGVNILVNRGYSSASAMFDSYERFKEAAYAGAKQIKVIYLGDFDPSGQDMIRDIEARTYEFWQGDSLFSGTRQENGYRYFDFEIDAIALTRQQIDLYDLPPNPAKLSDSRAAGFIAEHGEYSWEVDALRPEVLNDILDSAIRESVDLERYSAIELVEETETQKLRELMDKL